MSTEQLALDTPRRVRGGDLPPTHTRLALLRACAEGEVWVTAGGRTIVDRRWPEAVEPAFVVTAAIVELQHAGWVVLIKTKTGALHWRPTEAGWAVLAEAAGELPLGALTREDVTA